MQEPLETGVGSDARVRPRRGDALSSQAENLGERLVEICDEWTHAACSTQRVDRMSAEAAIRAVYRAALFQRPEIIWFDSLPELHRAVSVLDCYDACQRPAGDLASTRGAKIMSQAFHGGLLRPLADRPRLAGQLWAQPTELLGDWPVSAHLRGRVDAILQGVSTSQPKWHSSARFDQSGYRLVRDAGFGHSGAAQVLGALGDSFSATLWQCYLEFGAAAQPVISAALEVLREVGWWYPFEGLVLAVERPATLEFNAKGELDAIERPAVQWWNCESADYVRGLFIPADLWDKSLTEILAEPNLELRSVFLELRGWGTGLEPPRLLCSADDPANPGQVIKLLEVSGGETVRRLIEVANASLDMDGTRRSYVIEVPPDIDDPVAAVAATFGMDADGYRRLQRAC